jgi:DNA-binding XRE family transcriptional regulator
MSISWERGAICHQKCLMSLKIMISAAMPSPMVNARQIRAGRAWLGWSQQQLADASTVAKRTIIRAEQDGDEAAVQARTLRDIQRALEDAGVRFLFDGEVGTGIADAAPVGR